MRPTTENKSPAGAGTGHPITAGHRPRSRAQERPQTKPGPVIGGIAASTRPCMRRAPAGLGLVRRAARRVHRRRAPVLSLPQVATVCAPERAGWRLPVAFTLPQVRGAASAPAGAEQKKSPAGAGLIRWSLSWNLYSSQNLDFIGNQGAFPFRLVSPISICICRQGASVPNSVGYLSVSEN